MPAALPIDHIPPAIVRPLYSSSSSVLYSNSESPQKLDRVVHSMNSYTDTSLLHSCRDQLLQSLQAIEAEASQPGWGGEGELPVQKEWLDFMKLLISQFPIDLKVPELYPDPDGTIGMDWMFKDGTSLSATLMPSGKIAYAILGNEQEGYGKFSWNQLQFPKELEILIRFNERS